MNSVTLDVEFRGPAGLTPRMLAYWAGGTEWRVRLAAPQPGVYYYRSICSSNQDPGLHYAAGVARQARVICSPKPIPLRSSTLICN